MSMQAFVFSVIITIAINNNKAYVVIKVGDLLIGKTCSARVLKWLNNLKE